MWEASLDLLRPFPRHVDFTLKCYVSSLKGLSCLVSYLISNSSSSLSLMWQQDVSLVPCWTIVLAWYFLCHWNWLVQNPTNGTWHLCLLADHWNKYIFQTRKPRAVRAHGEAGHVRWGRKSHGRARVASSVGQWGGNSWDGKSECRAGPQRHRPNGSPVAGGRTLPEGLPEHSPCTPRGSSGSGPHHTAASDYVPVEAWGWPAPVSGGDLHSSLLRPRRGQE